jgi:hypothetical protein
MMRGPSQIDGADLEGVDRRTEAGADRDRALSQAVSRQAEHALSDCRARALSSFDLDCDAEQ